MTSECLTAIVAERVMGWTVAPDRFMTGKRRWMPRWRFQPLAKLDDAFGLLEKVDGVEGREIVGQKGNKDCAGILIPYYWPGDAGPFNYRLRRDTPDWTEGKGGKPKQDRKYLGPPRSINRLYVPPGITLEQLAGA